VISLDFRGAVQFIPYGGTSSLTFKEKGTFEYEMIKDEGISIKCKIIVKEQDK